MSLKDKRRLAVALVAATTTVAVLAACSSSGATSAANTSSPAGAAKLTGTPITIFQTNSFSGQVADQPQTKAGAQAAVAEINATGGINGHPVNLITCDNAANPDQTNTCVTQAKADGAVAFVGSAVFFPTAWPILNQEKIPYLFGESLTPNEDSSPISFPLSGQLGWYYGIAAYLKKLGVKHPALIRCEIAACAYGGTLLDQAYKLDGMGPGKTIVAPLATTDYSSYAAAAMAGGTDAVVVSGTEATAVPEATALRQQGFKGLIIGVSADINLSAAGELGSAGNGLYVIGLIQSPTISNAQVSEFTKYMNQVDSSAQKDELALTCWASVQLFAKVAEGLKTVTAATVLAALQSAKVGQYNVGVTAPVPGAATSPLSAYPRLYFSPTVTDNQIKGNTIVQTVPGFQNPFLSS
jgi:ABC-type branched-subunit amino acid transport system substrate-binding protein